RQAAHRPAVGPREVGGRLLPRGPLARDRRRPARRRPAHGRERAGTAGGAHQRHDLPGRRGPLLRLPLHDAEPRRPRAHRHARGRGQARGRRRDRGLRRGGRHAREPGRCRGGRGRAGERRGRGGRVTLGDGPAEAADGVPAGAAPGERRPPLPDYPRVRDLGGGVWVIDTLHQGHAGTIGAFLVALPRGGHALVETGPGVTLPEVLAGLEALGLEPRDVTHLLVTHVHLDHAGAAGALARLTGATVVAHEVGAPHLVDPSRLMASAQRVYGDALKRLWGEMVPAPADRVVAVRDGDVVPVGGLAVRVVHTPGHASHHVSYLLPDGTLFCGDSAGVVLPGAAVIRPALAPPELDIELKEASVRKQLALAPSRLVLSHFGPVPDAAAHLQAYPGVMRAWEAELLK